MIVHSIVLKRFSILCFLSFSITRVNAQRDSLIYSMDQQRIQNQQSGMLVLGSWSLINIATGVILKPRYQGSESYFHQMNALWNSVNLGIAAIGFFNSRKEIAVNEPMTAIERQIELEKSLLFNTGLDIAYITAGAWMLERAKSQSNPNKHDQFNGFGKSIIVQGSFLLLFDACFYAISSRNSKDLRRAVSLFYMAPNGIGIQKSF